MNANFYPAFALFQQFGGWEILALLGIALLLFGGKKLPELARGIGKALREFRKASHEAEEAFSEVLEDAAATDGSKQTKNTPPQPQADAEPSELKQKPSGSNAECSDEAQKPQT